MGGQPNEHTTDPRVPQTEGLQISDHRLSTSCGVVKRHDHHCDDDLVNLHSVCSTVPVHYVGTSSRTVSCFILNKLANINIKSVDDAGKN